MWIEITCSKNAGMQRFIILSSAYFIFARKAAAGGPRKDKPSALDTADKASRCSFDYTIRKIDSTYRRYTDVFARAVEDLLAVAVFVRT